MTSPPLKHTSPLGALNTVLQLHPSKLSNYSAIIYSVVIFFFLIPSHVSIISLYSDQQMGSVVMA